MAEVSSVFIKIIGEFLFELFVFYAIIFFRMEKQTSFLPRLLVSLVVLLTCAFGLSVLYLAIGNNAFGRIFIYVVLFVLSTLGVYSCYSLDYLTVIFCCSFAYGLQNFAYKLFQILWCFGENFHFFDGWGRNFTLFFYLIYYSYYALIVVVNYFLFAKDIRKRITNGKISLKMFSLSLLLLGITIILCSIEDVFFATFSDGRESQYVSTEIYVLRQTGNLFSIVCCIIVLRLCAKSIEEQDLKREVEYLKYAITQGEWQYEISKNTIDMINIKCHDIKYKIRSALSSSEALSPEAVSDLSESISIYDSRIETGNRLLDIILTEKSLFCEQNDISFSCMADGERLSFMRDGDVYCLFGNIVDNALEAVKNIEEKERRVVNITIKVKNKMIVVQEENYFNGQLTFNDGLPVTTKTDKDNHGFGMRSIRMITNYYDGTLTTYVENGVFHLNIIFPLKDEAKK